MGRRPCICKSLKKNVVVVVGSSRLDTVQVHVYKRIGGHQMPPTHCPTIRFREKQEAIRKRTACKKQTTKQTTKSTKQNATNRRRKAKAGSTQQTRSRKQDNKSAREIAEGKKQMRQAEGKRSTTKANEKSRKQKATNGLKRQTKGSKQNGESKERHHTKTRRRTSEDN